MVLDGLFKTLSKISNNFSKKDLEFSKKFKGFDENKIKKYEEITITTDDINSNNIKSKLNQQSLNICVR